MNGFDKYKNNGRPWTVRTVIDFTEDRGHKIEISGTPDNVKITCLDSPATHLYQPSRYDNVKDEIVSQGFAISYKQGTPNEITYTDLGVAGSWTADDSIL